MGFNTSIYSGFTPSLQNVGRVITSFQWTAWLGGTKYKVSFNDGTTWFVYVFPSGGGSYSLSQGVTGLVGNRKFNGYIHIAKIPIGDAASEATYDANNGAYVTGMALFRTTVGSIGTYGYTFAVAGVLSQLLEYLPRRFCILRFPIIKLLLTLLHRTRQQASTFSQPPWKKCECIMYPNGRW